jgi:hypothetical protein
MSVTLTNSRLFRPHAQVPNSGVSYIDIASEKISEQAAAFRRGIASIGKSVDASRPPMPVRGTIKTKS